MGTSKGISTPSGGGWTSVKTKITDVVGDSSTDYAKIEQIIGGVVAAAGGLGSATGVSAAGRSAEGGGTGGGRTSRGGGGIGGGSGKVGVGRAVSGLAGFGSAVREGGLNRAVEKLGLTDLRGRPAVEVVARIAEHLAESVGGPQGDLLAMALRDAILECAAIEGGGTYDDLDNSLQSYIAREGIDGLVDAFLSRFVFDRIWAWIETHSQERSETVRDKLALESAVESACREHVRSLMDDVRTEGTFDETDWFGKQGLEHGQQIVATLEFRLKSLQSEQS